MEVKDVVLDDISVSSLNVRKDLEAGTEDAGIAELAESIRDKGLLSPVIVMENLRGTYDLIVGQRRFLACSRLGWKTIPAIVRKVGSDMEAVTLSLIEGIHRADYNPIDKARAYQQLYDKYGSDSAVAKEVNVGSQTVKRYRSLLKLAPSIQQKVTTSTGFTGVGMLSKLAETFDLDEQEDVLDRISGFGQNIQVEILKGTGGDIDSLDDYVEMAHEGAFDIVTCHGLDECPYIPHELNGVIKQLLDDFARNGNTESFTEIIRKARKL